MKQYNLKELKLMNGKPVYINVKKDHNIYKSGWAIIQSFEDNDNIFASNGLFTIFIDKTTINNIFEIYDREPQPKTKIYNKLIRDNMKEIIEKDSKSSSMRYIKGQDMVTALKNKLQEEVDEFLESGHCSEIADIQEVLLCLIDELGYNFEEIEKIRIEKKKQKGSFHDGLFLESIEFNDILPQ